MSDNSAISKPTRLGDLEEKWRQSLQRRVLQHLKRQGPMGYDNLSLLFDLHRTGDTAKVVQTLKGRQYVEIGQDRRVRITESGLQLLTEEPSSQSCPINTSI